MRVIVSVAVALVALAYAVVRREWVLGAITWALQSEVGVWIVDALRRLFGESQIAQVRGITSAQFTQNLTALKISFHNVATHFSLHTFTGRPVGLSRLLRKLALAAVRLVPCSALAQTHEMRNSNAELRPKLCGCD